MSVFNLADDAGRLMKLLRGVGNFGQFIETHADDVTRLFSRYGDQMKSIKNEGDLTRFLDTHGDQLNDNFVQALRSNRAALALHIRTSNDMGQIMRSFAREARQGEDIAAFLTRKANDFDDVSDATINIMKHADNNAEFTRAAREIADSSLRGRAHQAAAAGRSAFEFAKRGFFTPTYQIRNRSTGLLETVTRQQARVYQSQGDTVIRGAGQLSVPRTALTVTTAAVANEVMGGVPSDLAVSVVTSSASPIGWVIRHAAGGFGEASESVLGEEWWQGEPPLPAWVQQAREQGLIREGEKILVDAENPDAPLDPEAYATLFNAENSPAQRDDGYLSPEIYEQLFPRLQALTQGTRPAVTPAPPEAETGDDEAPEGSTAGAGQEGTDPAQAGMTGLFNRESLASGMARFVGVGMLLSVLFNALGDAFNNQWLRERAQDIDNVVGSLQARIQNWGRGGVETQNGDALGVMAPANTPAPAPRETPALT